MSASNLHFSPSLRKTWSGALTLVVLMTAFSACQLPGVPGAQDRGPRSKSETIRPARRPTIPDP